VYCQGGTHWTHWALALASAVRSMDAAGLLPGGWQARAQAQAQQQQQQAGQAQEQQRAEGRGE
jgi:hypothetical protein